MRWKRHLLIIFLLTAAPLLQGSSPACTPPVLWNFEAASLPGHKVVLSLRASLAPGWHIYSQYLRGNGPQPTSISFQPNDDIIPFGLPDETGRAKKFYDELYEMDIILYTGTVSFQQKFELKVPQTVIRGKIVYMMCDDKVCMPDEREFSVVVDVLKESR